ncbi:MAG: cadherin repeat domain-containing protein [Cellvibrionales bacterium]|nr:cadherin repeat domain-containing protein [Cellvibrionales bacterium]
MKMGFFSLSLALSLMVHAAERTDNQKMVSQVRAYEKPNGVFHALIQLSSGRLSGVNPDANLAPCQLWTKNPWVFRRAMDAMINSLPLDLTYSGRGDKDDACQVKMLVEPKADSVSESLVLREVSMELAFNNRHSWAGESGVDESQLKLGLFDNGSVIQVWAQGVSGASPTQIYAQHVDYRLRPESDAFVVNTSVVAANERVSDANVVVMNNGNYAVSWIHWDSDNKPKARFRVFDEEGNQIRAEKNIPSSSLESIQMEALDDGGFVVIGRSSRTIKMDVFSSTGATVHREIIGTHGGDYGDNPDVTQLSNGHLGITWGRSGPFHGGILYSVYDLESKTTVRAYSVFGGPPPVRSDNHPHVVALDDGYAMALYESGTDLYLQKFDVDGYMVGDAKRVTDGEYHLADISMIRLRDNSLFVTWTDNSGQGTDRTGVWGRRLDANGEPLTSDRQLIPQDGAGNEYGYDVVGGSQSQSSIIQSRNGTVFASWIVDDGNETSTRIVEIGVNQVRTDANTATFVGQIKASDAENKDLTFTVLESDGAFSLNSYYGTIKVLNKHLIDYDTQQSHTLRFEVTDGEVTTEHEVTIQVIPDTK